MCGGHATRLMIQWGGDDWGELVGQLEQRGHPLAALDSLIAAIALAGDYTIATRNENDFVHTGAASINPWNVP